MKKCLIFLFAYLSLPFLPCFYAAQDIQDKGAKQAEEVSANEDLMREHGVLNRLLLIYQEIARRIESKQEFPIEALAKSAQLVQDFLENYHERLEEEYIFPRFEKANQLVDLVHTLKEQHIAGRKLTEYILSHANAKAMQDKEQRDHLVHYLLLYVQMFRPHEAREDTILFPAFRTLLSKEEYEKLGEKFEEIERQRFGEHGFEKIVDQVADIEKQLDIYNLFQFTPIFIGKLCPCACLCCTYIGAAAACGSSDRLQCVRRNE